MSESANHTSSSPAGIHAENLPDCACAMGATSSSPARETSSTESSSSSTVALPTTLFNGTALRPALRTTLSDEDAHKHLLRWVHQHQALHTHHLTRHTHHSPPSHRHPTTIPPSPSFRWGLDATDLAEPEVLVYPHFAYRRTFYPACNPWPSAPRENDLDPVFQLFGKRQPMDGIHLLDNPKTLLQIAVRAQCTASSFDMSGPDHHNEILTPFYPPSPSPPVRHLTLAEPLPALVPACAAQHHSRRHR